MEMAMTVFETPLFKSFLSVPMVSRIRRNHGLEHATLHVLSKRHPGVNLAGHSDARGFWLVGDVPIEDVQEAIEEALSRMRGGEHNLAVHQNCGTNFVTAGSLAGLAAGVAMLGSGKRVGPAAGFDLTGEGNHLRATGRADGHRNHLDPPGRRSGLSSNHARIK
jgi:hypothetical protein